MGIGCSVMADIVVKMAVVDIDFHIYFVIDMVEGSFAADN
jgi:hypothetical protein